MKMFAAFTLVALSTAGSATPPTSPAAAVASQVVISDGKWVGKFFQKDWTFEFRNSTSGLTGRFITSGGKSWQPLNQLKLEGRSLSFSIASEPEMRFALEYVEPRKELDGTVTLEGYATVPFKAVKAM